MEWTWLNFIAFILIPLLTAGIGGWVGAYFGGYRGTGSLFESVALQSCFTEKLS